MKKASAIKQMPFYLRKKFFLSKTVTSKDSEFLTSWEIDGVCFKPTITMIKDQPQPPFQEPVFLEKWEEWMQYRKQRKLPKYVPVGLKKTWDNLAKLSEGKVAVACAIIDQSMYQNWQGLFQLKGTYVNISNTNGSVGNSAAKLDKLKNLGRE